MKGAEQGKPLDPSSGLVKPQPPVPVGSMCDSGISLPFGLMNDAARERRPSTATSQGISLSCGLQD